MYYFAVNLYFQLFAKLQATKQEIQDLQEEHVKERQELEQTQNELTRELKLKLVFMKTIFHATTPKEGHLDLPLFICPEFSNFMKKLEKWGGHLWPMLLKENAEKFKNPVL